MSDPLVIAFPDAQKADMLPNKLLSCKRGKIAIEGAVLAVR